MLLSKIVDDILLCGPDENVDCTVKDIERHFRLGTVAGVPEIICYFGINIIQHDDLAVKNHGDDKLCAIETNPLTRV